MAKHKHYSHELAERIIEQSMTALGLQEHMLTDPHIIREILTEFRLNDFKTRNVEMKRFFKEVTTQPQQFQPVFRNIKRGIVNKHPAIVEFAEMALERGWFEPSEQVLRAVHVTYILEALTAGMSNNHQFFLELQKYYKAQARRCGIDLKHLMGSVWQMLDTTHDFFGTMKALSVDPVMIYFQTQHKEMEDAQAKKLLKKKKINYLEYKFLTPMRKKDRERINELVRINIYEAGITEHTRGLQANALCAHELAQDLLNYPAQIAFAPKMVLPKGTDGIFYRSVRQKDSQFITMGLSQEWVSLYTSWNMAFVLFYFDDLDIVLPKLFIPSLIDAEPENFIGVRALVLWLTLHHYFYRKFNHTPVVPGPANKVAMAKAWAEINKRYAFDLARYKTRESRGAVTKSYKRWFAHPFYHFYQLAKNFLTS